MIVVELVGGLGNQMFQYAAGRALADRLATTLGLDVRPLAASDGRPFRVGRFAIRATVMDPRDLVGTHGRRSLGRLLTTGIPEWVQRMRRRPRFAGATRIIHQAPSYSDVLNRAGDHSWLCGYWQSERYFLTAADALRRDFTLKAISGESAALAERLAAFDYPVAVHVRRGDYAHIPSTRNYHGLLDESYYGSAMTRIRARRSDASFVFFSDEPDWVADRFGAAAALVVRANANRPEEDLHLMTRCRSHVIANSSFSWWGAWLADSDEVIAPASWYRAPHVDGRDVVPGRWTRL